MEEIAVGKLADIADGDYRVFAVDKLEVVIFRTGSKVLAYENVCPHAGGPLGEGALHGSTLVCPWHAWEFDCRTGACDLDPSVGVAAYEVKVENGEILILLP